MRLSSRSFFHFVWKFNAIAIACASLLAIGIGALGVYEFARHMFRERQVTNVAVAEPESGQPEQKNANYVIGSFTPLRGSQMLWAPLHLRQNFNVRYTSKAASSIANYIFYDPLTRKAHKLLPSDTQIIIKTHYLSREPYRDDRPVAALAFEIVEKDTNGDGVMTHSDSRRLAISKADGTDLTRLPQLFADILGTFVIQDGTLVFMVRHDDKVQAMHVNPDTFEVAANHKVTR